MPALQDIATISIGSRTAEDLAPSIRQACVSLGFLYLADTGLEQEVSELFEISKRFFLKEAREEKERCTRTADNVGYVAVRDERLDPTHKSAGDLKEVFNIGHITSDAPPKASQAMPQLLGSHLDTLARFQRRCHELCYLLLDALALSLDLPKDFFSSQHVDNPSDPSILRLLRYPPVPAGTDSNEIRAGAHSDYGSLTLLFQRRDGCAGLEVLPPTDEKVSEASWRAVPVIPGAVLVNIGDAMEFWSGALFKSTVHRVRQAPESDGSGSAERYSIAFFCQPRRDAPLHNVSSASEVTQHDIARMEAKGVKLGEKLTAGEHLQRRLDRTYK